MRILFVESDKFLRDFFGSKLREEYKVTIDLVTNGKEAIKLLKTERPYDVIISDYQYPAGSGANLLQFKIKNGITGIFIFFCTVREEIPYSLKEFKQIDKFSYGTLCKEIGLKS